MTSADAARALFLVPAEGGYRASAEVLHLESLPEGDLVVRCLYSGINYKDALAVLGRGRIVRAALPFVPGIDVAAEVIESRSPRFAPGDLVIQTGWGLGETRWGGFASHQRLESDHVVALPTGMTAEQAMQAGTAGFTAALAVMALEDHGVSREQEVVVTGATGGLGSFAVLLLARSGFRVAAVTGKPDATRYLEGLGAGRVLGRAEFSTGASRPLDEGRWAGAIDSVGGKTLSALLSQTATHGSVAACGLAGGSTFESSVFPFILRGVNLLGIDSNTCPIPRRLSAWDRLRDLFRDSRILPDSRRVTLDGVVRACADVLDGRIQGRVLVDCAP